MVQCTRSLARSNIAHFCPIIILPSQPEKRRGERENQVGTAGDWGDTPHCDVMHVLRGLPYMTSAQRGRGVEKYLKLADKQYIKFGQKGWG